MNEINDLVNEINRDIAMRKALLSNALVGVGITTTAVVVAGVAIYKLHKRISAVEEQQQQHTPE